MILDEKGFVFLDDSNRPYLVRMWGESPWLFFWNNPGWVSQRKLNQSEIWTFNRHAISDELANVYHEKHAKFIEL